MGKRLILSLICLVFTGCSTVKFIAREELIQPDKFFPAQADRDGGTDSGPRDEEKALCDFHAGEKLIYRVQWLGMNVAQAVIEVQGIVEIEGREVYKIKLVAETNGLVAKIFPVRNEYLSYVDTKNIHSLKNETERCEGKRKKKNATVFDRVNQKAYYTDFLNNRKRVVDIPENTYDVLGAAYYFRTLDVGVGDTINYNVFSDGKVYPLYAAVKKRQCLAICDFRSFETFLIEPYIIRDGKIDRRAKIKAYFSTDKDRLPVYISLKGPVFTRINILLQAIEKNDQESLQSNTNSLVLDAKQS